MKYNKKKVIKSFMKSYLKSNVMGNNSLEIQKNSLQAPISQNGQTLKQFFGNLPTREGGVGLFPI